MQLKCPTWLVTCLSLIALLGLMVPTASASTPVLGPILDIGLPGKENFQAAIAYDGVHHEYLVVWHNSDGSTLDVYARRVHADGTVEPAFYAIASVPGGKKWQADVAYSPVQDEYLIVYTYTSSYGPDIWGVRTSWDLDWKSVEFPIYPDPVIDLPVNNDSQRNPAVTYNSQDDEFVITWEWEHGSGGLCDVWARRMYASGGWLTPAACVATGGNGGDGLNRTDPDVAYDADRNELLIAYTKQRITDGDIAGRVVPANLGGMGTIPELALVDNSYEQNSVALAAGPDEYLAVWSDGPSGAAPSQRTIYGRRVHGDGTLAAHYVPIVNVAGELHRAPAVAFGWGERYLISWSHRFLFGGTTFDTDIYGRYLHAGQDVPEADIFGIDWRYGLQERPAVACDPGGECLVAAEDVSDGAYFRIRGRLVGPHCVYLPLTLRSF